MSFRSTSQTVRTNGHGTKQVHRRGKREGGKEPVSKHQIRSGNGRWAGRRGVVRLNPRRETKIRGANREVSERKLSLWPRSVFFLRGPTRSGERSRLVGLFQGCTGLGRLDAGSHAGFTSSRAPPPWISVFEFSLFLYYVWPCGTWAC